MLKKYETLVDWVRNKIMTRELKYGDKLMSEYEFCEKFNVSRQVVRRAIEVLKEENLVNTQRGSGSYVCCKLPEIRKQTKTIAFVTGSLNRYIYPQFLEGMQRILSSKDYTMQLFLSENNPCKTASNLMNIIDNNMADGIVLSPQRTGIPDPNFELYQKIAKSDIPAIFFNSFIPNVEIPYVGLDDFEVGYCATDYLCNAGHKKIGCLALVEDYQAHLRYSGYYAALMKHNIEYNIENIIWCDSLDFRLYEGIELKVYQRIKNCTAIFCYNDMMAARVFDTCKKYGIKVPEDLSIISVDNTNLAEFNEIKLTSIYHPFEEMGEKVASNMLSLINGEKIDGCKFIPKIVERDSVFNRNLINR